ncbi:hypothetical protein CDD82_2702 [Ophiocordyceps australis]|uniref:Uncharacterized protein n=1 Tax=Ophiocordyceps australis TaxID=1399860 RepID=A0A2C5XVW5_9HYPO|nr:hypothetical protein CDD82_2702 [Ophiocordyceps australis]
MGWTSAARLTRRRSTFCRRWWPNATKLEISARSEDIRVYLQQSVRQQPRLLRHVEADAALEEEIVSTIVDASRGMFLLAALAVESLSRKINRKQVRACLSNIPPTLDATYEQALSRIRSQAVDDAALADSVIFWVFCARTRLTVVQLQHMYAMATREAGETDEADAPADDELPDGDVMLGVCGGLIVVDPRSALVGPVHYTAQQFFERSQQRRLLEARAQVTGMALAYLKLPGLSSGPCVSDAAMTLRLDRYPLLDYAARYWGSEREAITTEALWHAIRGFVASDAAVQAVNQVASLPKHRCLNWSQEFPRHVPALVMTAKAATVRLL